MSNHKFKLFSMLVSLLLLPACSALGSNNSKNNSINEAQKITTAATTRLQDPALDYSSGVTHLSDRVISRSQYQDQLHGFWLGQNTF